MGRVYGRLGTPEPHLPGHLCLTARPWANLSDWPVGFAQWSGPWWALKHSLKSLELGFEWPVLCLPWTVLFCLNLNHHSFALVPDAGDP